MELVALQTPAYRLYWAGIVYLYYDLAFGEELHLRPIYFFMLSICACIKLVWILFKFVGKIFYLIISCIKFVFPYAHSEGFSVVSPFECKMS